MTRAGHAGPAALPWFAPQMTGLEPERIKEVIDANYLNEGETTAEFERRVAQRLGVAHAVATTSGTAAISLALMACGVRPGDEVIVPAFTFIATANAARLAGADVRLVDVTRERMTIDADAAEAAISSRTRAIVAVDVNGRAAPYEALERLAGEHDLALVCDSAEALGSSSYGQALGSFGDAGCLSFSAAKTITTGQGGMVLTSSSAVRDRLLELKDQGRRQRGTGGDDDHPVLGFNFKFTNLQAAVGLAQLEALDNRLAAFQRRNDWYSEAFHAQDEVEIPPTQPDEVTQWFDILIDEPKALEAALAEAGMGSRCFWHPLNSQPPYSGPFEYPTARTVSRRGLWLPSSFDLNEADVARVVGAVTAFLRRDRAR